MEIFDLIPREKLNKLIKECDLLITHGGVGSILNGLKNNKKVIAAARLKEYKEHTNNHQLQILDNLKKEGYILVLDDFDKLNELLLEVNNFKPKKFKSNTNKIIKIVEDFIDNN
jgi:UDP-N-acetylglucosamine transferase subunit ALG13